MESVPLGLGGVVLPEDNYHNRAEFLFLPFGTRMQSLLPRVLVNL